MCGGNVRVTGGGGSCSLVLGGAHGILLTHLCREVAMINTVSAREVCSIYISWLQHLSVGEGWCGGCRVSVNGA